MMGGDSNGVLFKDFCWAEWRDKYGIKPPWGGREFTNLAAARSRFDNEDEARAAWLVYLKNTDTFFEGHGPGKFLMELSKFVARAAKTLPKKPASFPGAERAAEMVRIRMEVERDASIPESSKRDEMSRRWKSIEV